ncbi:Carbonic anhydrase [Aquicella siphonis]|uniref:carbonic anhydrase n=1 Tax=Aquicella siphonis TaxID=254247 RepID=A0A5E4PLH7_9COXI|nr:carbonic anhydrase [Aquicella siphonis]VVC77261.1 Carbonic anhydrase [Aquicella siphonis]
MEKSISKILEGYQQFRKKYALGDNSIMQTLASRGQRPEIMVIACCDSRVDPALILQCDPGDLFVVRNVANIIPPYEKDEAHHGTSAALEFGICYLNVKHIIILGHSQCGGINATLNQESLHQNDFISSWVSLIGPRSNKIMNADDYAKQAMLISYKNCLTFPWIREKMDKQALLLHLWFFDIEKGEIYSYSHQKNEYTLLIN